MPAYQNKILEEQSKNANHFQRGEKQKDGKSKNIEFSTATLKGVRTITSKYFRNHACQILYQIINRVCKGRIKIFIDKQGLKNFTSHAPFLKKPL